MGLSKEQYWYWFCNLPGIGIQRQKKLIAYFKCVENIYQASEKELRNVITLSDVQWETFFHQRNAEWIQKNYDKLQKAGIYFLSMNHDAYPQMLKEIYDPPYGIYYKGQLPIVLRPGIAIVGARNCSNYGKEITLYFAETLATYGFAIISGLASGIDAFAHQGAIVGGGKTYAVLGCGIDRCYPKENQQLYEKIQAHGGILSEYRPGISPKPGLFPMRNRLISGLCDGVLVVEARKKSGALITVELGLQQGKNIYAIPGRVTDQLSVGCHSLIQEGAKLITKPEQVVEDYFEKYEKVVKKQKNSGTTLEREEKIVYANLSFYPTHVEELLEKTQMGVVQLMHILTNLEWKDQIKQMGNCYYVWK